MFKASKLVSITSWNINGINKRINGQRTSKMDEDEFKQRMVSDIVFLCETHLANNDNLYYSGYKYFSNCRSIETSRLKGGLGLFVKQSLIKGVKIIDTSCSEYIWVKLCRNYFGFDKDIYVCFLYIPPINSTYAKRTGLNKIIFDKVESDICRWHTEGDIVLMGDFNAHINETDLDFIELDTHDPSNDSLSQIYVSDSVLLKRNTQIDQTTNTYGRQLIELCRSSRLRILNGRTLGDTMGRITFFNTLGTAIDDYCICNASLLPNVCSFEVNDYMPNISDHCPITLTIQAYFFKRPDANLQTIHSPKWTLKHEDTFRANLSQSNFNAMKKRASHFLTKGESSGVDSIIVDFTSMLQCALGRPNRRKTNKKKRNDKPWFDIDCKSKLRRIRSLCKILKSEPWDATLRLQIMQERKLLKTTIRKNHRLYKKKILDKLTSNESNNSSTFWQLINKIKKKEVKDTSLNISDKEWVQYFSNLMNVSQPDNFLSSSNPCDIRINADSGCLNSKITGEEVLKAIKSLKRRKSCGPDLILNEMIITSCNFDVNIFCDIFNLILNTGVYPDSWRDNFIKPIFKGGSCNDPSNYRGIALASTLSKLFTRIMYNRLQTYLEENELIAKEQIGFKKGSRTSDHIFTLKTMIDNMFKKKKYMYVCFVDFRKAFDLVNRKALLYKLKLFNINGNFLQIMESMYKEVRFSVKLGNASTPSFTTSVGVKQGCVLSPTLFSMYINDMVDIFNDTDCHPVCINDQNVSCLLYADDLVIVSESATGLQNAISKLENYCVKWNLEINLNKTQIMIFNKAGRTIHNREFYFSNKVIQVANEYKYLGIIFKPSGSFTHAVKHLISKAKKAMFSLRNVMPQNRISLIPYLRLFDTCIQPILLYGAEIWSLDYLYKNTIQPEKNYLNFLPENVHLKFLKIIMGLQRSAVNIAVLSETGRFPLAIHAIKSTVSFWHHLVNLKDKTLAKDTYYHSFCNDIGICNKLRLFLTSFNFTHVWENQNTPSIKGLNRAITMKVKERYITYWRSCLNENNHNYVSKLRTYKYIKEDYKQESYLLTDVDKEYVSIFSKLRISNSKLMIEEGRHTNLEVKDRICPLCKADIENETHFVIECLPLTPIRSALYKDINDIVPEFHIFGNKEKFKFIMTSNDQDINRICINGIAKMYNSRLSSLPSNYHT